MSTRQKSRKRTGSFKKGNPRELKSALSAKEAQPTSLLSLYLKEMEDFFSTASVLAADLEGELEYNLILRGLMEGQDRTRVLIQPIITENLQKCQRLAMRLRGLSEYGMASHRKRSKHLGGASHQKIDYSSLSEDGTEATWATLGVAWEKVLGPKP